MERGSVDPDFEAFEALVKKVCSVEEKYLLGLVDEYGTGVLTMTVSRRYCEDLAEIIIEMLEDPRYDKEFKKELLAVQLWGMDKVRGEINSLSLRRAKQRSSRIKRWVGVVRRLGLRSRINTLFGAQ